MKIEFVDLKAQYLSIKSQIDEAIFRVVNETAFIKGKYLEQFENEYAQFMGMPYCVGCANGTDSLEIALRALGVKNQDEVIVPANTWISTAEAVTSVGGNVVFVDSDPELYTIDVSKIEEKISSKTKAIIPVHFYGLPAEMDQILDLAKKYNLKVIEDCAQAHGATYKGKLIGTIGDISSFSFFPGKNLGAYGDAGALVMKDEELRTLCRMIGDHGRLGKHDHGLEGRNSRLDGLQASILSAKLSYLSQWVKARQDKARIYDKVLEGLSIQKPTIPDYSTHAFHLYVIQVSNRQKIQEFLLSKGIATGVHYPTALPFTTAYRYKNHSQSDFPVSYNQMSKILSLPIYPELTTNQIEYIGENLKLALKTFN